MSDQIERVKSALKKYGIRSEEELIQAMEKQFRVDIGIFTMPCGMEDNNVEKVS